MDRTALTGVSVAGHGSGDGVARVAFPNRVPTAAGPRYLDGHGTLRRVLQVATGCGFVVDELATGNSGVDDGYQSGAANGQRTVETVLQCTAQAR